MVYNKKTKEYILKYRKNNREEYLVRKHREWILYYERHKDDVKQRITSHYHRKKLLKMTTPPHHPLSDNSILPQCHISHE
jgi:hypothetical protein